MEDPRERAYKAVAYSAVTFSLVAILSVCITMPIVYNFVDHVQQQTKRDLQFCKPGQPGPQGERGICPKYCALDGGVFFEDGTRR
ncbi:unnamed protein product [Nippostrongylus brasiliensis]|uniref:Col_cuticle_N domain-containing protein n=1 Tax=Nippostrongylus brasiliensis TaxID=27835 RepID=A0A158QXD9_NIPBR|nr:unnamed protein product [Nippostrongylus brasiliensis]